MQLKVATKDEDKKIYRPFEQIMRSIDLDTKIHGSLDIISSTVSRARNDAEDNECPLTADERADSQESCGGRGAACRLSAATL
jgi:hypothetical protein